MQMKFQKGSKKSIPNRCCFWKKLIPGQKNKAIAIFTHEQKNLIRNVIEELLGGEYLSSPNRKSEIETKLIEIKNKENKLVDKLSAINDSLFDVYKKQMNG